ncbi:hypothetical protein SAMN02745163_01071 [Clostridium cavendishii DSM 21758]|uniref:histidine kinase n=1 Tax=Clostridium cavendishii DSM 21758 TaxID=1121302 RepID=A0A1M6F9H3_9CLOT|nr:sensor histidine kinase [Clostridium cavendishii]SHI94323.1 hypothetical protein SAMN02745163_01071 [Clostridium cavendishii DSM 21758]
MSLGDYLKSRVNIILLNIVGLISLIIFLISVGNNLDTIGVITFVWILIFSLFITIQYKKRKEYFDGILDTCEKLDKKYISSEVIDEPHYIESIPYYMLLKKSSKAMREEINKVKIQRKEYREYIEQWIHEVKAPIAAIKLIEENSRNETSRLVLQELESIDRFVEQALFYARSEEVEKDYLIKEIELEQCINRVLIKNKQMFILNNIDVELENIDKSVYSDSKWLEFTINQIVVNSIKYRKKDYSKVKIYANDVKNGIELIIEDNGIGIPKNEVNRVFEKGFTGNKGRVNNKSTGIGLYLCKKLCDRLGVLISIESEENLYTKVAMTFPKGTFSSSDLILHR